MLPMSDLLEPTRVGRLNRDRAAVLLRDGCLLLRGAVGADLADELRKAFDAGETDDWPVPRGSGWRHALVDLDPAVQKVCRLPDLLAAAAELIGGPFFLGQVEGREPRQGGGFQGLHRDAADCPQGQVVSALIYLDDYGPANGATRILAGSQGGEPAAGAAAEAMATILEGKAGDILVFDANVLHGATCNGSGARRRSLLVTYAAVALHQSWRATQAVRSVRMSTEEIFA